MTQLALKHHTKMKSQNRRRRCSCCCDTQPSRPPSADHPSHVVAPVVLSSESLQCYDISPTTLMNTTVHSRVRPRRNEIKTKPLWHTMLLIMVTWTASQPQLPLPVPPQCDAFTTVLPKQRFTVSVPHLYSVVPSDNNNSKVARSGAKRKGTTKTSRRQQDEATITITSSSSSSSSSSSRKGTESLTEREMKESMLSTLKRDKRKKLLSRQDYQLEKSMLSHDLLSKEQEYEFTHLYHAAKELQVQINTLLLQKQKQQEEQKRDLAKANERENFVLNELGMNDFDMDDDDDDDDETDQFDETYKYLGRTKNTKKNQKKSTFMNTYNDYMEYQQQSDYENDDDGEYLVSSTSSSIQSSVRWKSQLLERLDQSSRTTMVSLLYDTPITTTTTTNDTDNENTDVTNDDRIFYDAFAPIDMDADTISTTNLNWNDSDQLSISSSSSSTNHLSERDIVELLNIPGGRKEMEHILLIGAQARDTLIRSNLKLVSSICKKWARTSSGQGGSNGATSYLKGPDSYFTIYSGSWDRPSLSEAIQEGVIGLTTAVERFDPSRGLRFSTYATYWITNSVRQCFQRASTGCLRLPTNYYDTRSRFKTLVRKYYEVDGDVPSMDVLAEEMGLSENRLQWILSITQGLLSMEGLLVPRGSYTRAGKAGNINRMEDSLLLADTLADNTNYGSSEYGNNPMDCVELSFLRQQLESAMAVELVPFERDVLRLRLGLDDGVTRNCREVAQMCGGRLKQSDIRTVERRALKKLRSPVALATYKLLTFLDFADVDIQTITM